MSSTSKCARKPCLRLRQGHVRHARRTHSGRVAPNPSGSPSRVHVRDVAAELVETRVGAVFEDPDLGIVYKAETIDACVEDGIERWQRRGNRGRLGPGTVKALLRGPAGPGARRRGRTGRALSVLRRHPDLHLRRAGERGQVDGHDRRLVVDDLRQTMDELAARGGFSNDTTSLASRPTSTTSSTQGAS